MATEPLTRTERLLALILLHDMHDASKGDKISLLARADIDYEEIAELVGTTSQTVRQSVYEKKRASKKRPPTAAGKRARRRR